MVVQRHIATQQRARPPHHIGWRGWSGTTEVGLSGSTDVGLSGSSDVGLSGSSEVGRRGNGRLGWRHSKALVAANRAGGDNAPWAVRRVKPINAVGAVAAATGMDSRLQESSMQLTQDQAATLFALLPTTLRAQASMHAIADPAGLGRYVAAACGLAADRGIWVDSAGQVQHGHSSVTPQASGLAIEAAAVDAAVVKKADKALKALLTAEERGAALVAALYAAGFVLTIDVARATDS